MALRTLPRSTSAHVIAISLDSDWGMGHSKLNIPQQVLKLIVVPSCPSRQPRHPMQGLCNLEHCCNAGLAVFATLDLWREGADDIDTGITRHGAGPARRTHVPSR